MLKEGTIVDATIVDAPQGRKVRELDGTERHTHDACATYTKNHGTLRHGYKAHLATDTRGIVTDCDDMRSEAALTKDVPPHQHRCCRPPDGDRQAQQIAPTEQPHEGLVGHRHGLQVAQLPREAGDQPHRCERHQERRKSHPSDEQAVHQTDGCADGDTDVTAAGAGVRTYVVAAREDLQIAAESRTLLPKCTSGPP